MRESFGQAPQRGAWRWLGMGLVVCSTWALTACGGSEEPGVDAADQLAMAGSDEWLHTDSNEARTLNGLAERSNQGDV